MLKRNYFYTAEPKEKNVTKEEFEQFIRNYPRELEKHVSGICYPPAISYNDFELANRWPYRAVAKTFMYTDDEGDLWNEPEENRSYVIMENYEEVFASKTGNMAD